MQLFWTMFMDCKSTGERSTDFWRTGTPIIHKFISYLIYFDYAFSNKCSAVSRIQQSFPGKCCRFCTGLHFTFIRRFYPKQLTGYTCMSVCVFPGNWTHNLCAANAMLYHWATGTLLMANTGLLITCIMNACLGI